MDDPIHTLARALWEQSAPLGATWRYDGKPLPDYWDRPARDLLAKVEPMIALTHNDVREMLRDKIPDGMSHATFAQMVGTTKSRISEVLAGKRRPNTAMLTFLGLESGAIRARSHK